MSRSLYLAGGLAAIFLIVLAQRVTVVPTASVGHAAATSAARKAPDDATAPPARAPDDPAATAIDDLAAWPGVTRR
jgi:hypothetical protein